jgi:hypothetical protein
LFKLNFQDANFSGHIHRVFYDGNRIRRCAFQLRASFLGMCRTKELGDVWIVPARALPNQGEPNIWRSFLPPPFCPAVGEKSDRMTKKLAGISEFGFNPNQCPSRWSTPKFWLGSYGQQSKHTLIIYELDRCNRRPMSLCTFHLNFAFLVLTVYCHCC